MEVLTSGRCTSEEFRGICPGGQGIITFRSVGTNGTGLFATKTGNTEVECLMRHFARGAGLHIEADMQTFVGPTLFMEILGAVCAGLKEKPMAHTHVGYVACCDTNAEHGARVELRKLPEIVVPGKEVPLFSYSKGGIWTGERRTGHFLSIADPEVGPLLAKGWCEQVHAAVIFEAMHYTCNVGPAIRLWDGGDTCPLSVPLMAAFGGAVKQMWDL